MNRRKSVVEYTLSHCVKCLKCVKACPTSALSMEKGKIIIDENRCINCGRCISSCFNKGLLARGSSLDDIRNYDYTICIVPSSLTSSCKSLEEAQDLYHAIQLLGFDEVVDLSSVEGQMMKETQLLSEQFETTTVISSFCPVINQLIEMNYPMLLDEIAPLEYPCEVLAKQLRKSHVDFGKVGIFNLCECEAKLTIAKFPYGNRQYEIDHALAIVDIFPKIRENLNLGKMEVFFSREGLQSCNPSAMLQRDEYLIADGFDKINLILNLEEFGQLNSYRLLYLFPCFNGCLGGHLLWGNSFLTKNNIHNLTSQKTKNVSKIDFDDIYSEEICLTKEEDKRSFQERMSTFKKVNEVLDKLPGYDCSACGLQTCRIMAEEIVKGTKVMDDCHIIHALQAKEESHEGK